MINNFFSNNLERARAARLKKAADKLVIVMLLRPFDSSEYQVIRMEHLERIVGIGNPKHTVQDIHNILKAYYRVAKKRFMDNVCMQATDYYLVCGPETPLKVFSPSFVGNLTSD